MALDQSALLELVEVLSGADDGELMREPALEDAEGLHAAVTVAATPVDEFSDLGVDPNLGQRDAANSGVQLAVPASRQAMAGVVGRPDRQRRGAVVPGVGVFGGEPVDARRLPDDLRGGQGGDTDDGEQVWRQSMHDGVDLP